MTYKWRPGNVCEKLPKNAFQGGTDVGGCEIFVGRALHCGFMLPAKIIPAKKSAYVSHNGVEIPVQNFEVLTGKAKDFGWIPASDGNVAPGAISVSEYGNEQLFIGRAAYQSSLTIGKIHPSHRVLYIPFSGYEVSFQHYEVLVSTKKVKNKEKKKKKSGKKCSGSSSSSSSDSD